MSIIKTNEDFSEYFNDKNRIIPLSHFKEVCKKGNNCRYSCLVPQGITCIKNTPLKKIIDNEVLNNKKWKKTGDNCDGFGEREKIA